MNCSWTLYEARTRAKELEEFHLKWLEEPLWPPETYDGLAQLRRACRIASTLMDFDRLMAAGAVDFVQPSPAKMGGISELRKVFPIAAVRNIAVMPHCFYDGPGLLAAIHATAALETTELNDEWRRFDLEAQIYNGALTSKGGRVSVPQSPLGLELDHNVIRAYSRI